MTYDMISIMKIDQQSLSRRVIEVLILEIQSVLHTGNILEISAFTLKPSYWLIICPRYLTILTK